MAYDTMITDLDGDGEKDILFGLSSTCWPTQSKCGLVQETEGESNVQFRFRLKTNDDVEKICF